jgi:hypothetical protein
MSTNYGIQHPDFEERHPVSRWVLDTFNPAGRLV